MITQQVLLAALGLFITGAFTYSIGYLVGSMAGYSRGIEDGERRGKPIESLKPEEVIQQAHSKDNYS